MDVLQAGIGEFSVTDPDELRAFMRTEKRRAMVDKVMPEAEAVCRYVKDSDYVSFDFPSFTRGPASLVREIIRQRRRDLWFSAKTLRHLAGDAVGVPFLISMSTA